MSRILFSAITFLIAQPAFSLGDAVNHLDYFTFASDASIVLRQDLKKISTETRGNLMVGGDASYPDVSGEFVQVMNKATSVGARKHVYLEGPGGPTGSGGIAGDECRRMIARARAVGITIDRNNCSSSAQWIKKWNSYGWWDSLIVEAEYFYKRYGVDSLEVDNLYRAGIESAPSVVRFIRKFQKAMIAKNMPISIMLKNLTVDDLNTVRADMMSSDPDRIQRAYLTDFMISEEDFKGQWTAIAAASKRIGIKMLKSTNTYNYQARGYWN